MGYYHFDKGSIVLFFVCENSSVNEEGVLLLIMLIKIKTKLNEPLSYSILVSNKVSAPSLNF